MEPQNIVSLNETGIDYQEGLSRFSGHEAIYEKYLKRFPDAQEYPDLIKAMDAKDYEAAFKLAHTLKGVTGNLSLNSFLETLKEFVEDLRSGANIQAAVELFPLLTKKYNAACLCIKNIFNV